MNFGWSRNGSHKFSDGEGPERFGRRRFFYNSPIHDPDVFKQLNVKGAWLGIPDVLQLYQQDLDKMSEDCVQIQYQNTK